jgi:hypothetical protein
MAANLIVMSMFFEGNIQAEYERNSTDLSSESKKAVRPYGSW